MRIFTAAAIAVLLSSGVVYAQENTTTGATGTEAGQSDGNPNYLTGPNIQRFYTDETMGTMKPEAEVKSTWEAMSEQERADAKQACSGNKDTRWSALCNSIGAM